MNKLEITNRQITETQKGVIDGQEVFFQVSYTEGKAIEMVNFSLQNVETEKMIAGSYYIFTGELNINAKNILKSEDVVIISKIIKIILESFKQQIEK